MEQGLILNDIQWVEKDYLGNYGTVNLILLSSREIPKLTWDSINES